MVFFAFLAALCLVIVEHEIAALIQVVIFGPRRSILEAPRVADDLEIPKKRRGTTLDAILLAVFPKRFDECFASNATDVVALLRQSGYYYATPREFYAAAIRDFSQYLVIGVALAIGLVILDMPVAAVPILAIYIGQLLILVCQPRVAIRQSRWIKSAQFPRVLAKIIIKWTFAQGSVIHVFTMIYQPT